MRLSSSTGLLLSALCLVGCGGEDIFYVPVGGASTGRFGTARKIGAFLDGKTLTMSGAAVPTHPNGFDENINFGQATQCYQKVRMTPLGGKYTVVSELGTLVGAPDNGDVGTCDRASLSTQLSFDSTAVLIDNVQGNGECFDFTITYPGFGQEGRGRIEEDGARVTLELFFKDQAIGHRCADGAVGAQTVTLKQASFDGDALQVYSVGS